MLSAGIGVRSATMKLCTGIAAAACMFGAGGMDAVAASDECAAAPLAVAGVAVAGNTGVAGIESHMVSQGCGTDFAGGVPRYDGRDVFTRFVSPASGLYRVRLASAAFAEATLTLYSRCEDPQTTGPWPELGCTWQPVSGALPYITRRLSAGESMIVRVATFDAVGGEFELIVEGPLAAAGNDDCASPSTLTLGTPVSGTLGNTTWQPLSPLGSACGQSGDPARPAIEKHDAWFELVAPAQGTYEFDAAGSTLTHVSLSLFIACYDPSNTDPTARTDRPFTNSACSAGSPESTRVSIGLETGQRVLVRVGTQDDLNAGGGAFVLTSRTIAGPAHDDCTGAVAMLANEVYTGDSRGATTSVTLPFFACGADRRTDSGAKDVFHAFTPATTGWYSFTTCAACLGPGEFPTVLSVHSGCPATETNLLACSRAFDAFTDDCVLCLSQPYSASLVPAVELQAGQTYYIRVAGIADTDAGALPIADGRTGGYSIQCFDTFAPDSPSNQTCEQAASIDVGLSVIGSVERVLEPSDIACPPGGQPARFGLWYEFVASSAATYDFTVAPRLESSRPLYSALLTLHDSCEATARNCDALGAPVTGGVESGIVLSAGQRVLVRVAGFEMRGEFVLGVRQTATPVHADCNTAPVVSAGSTTVLSTAGCLLSNSAANYCVQEDISIGARAAWVRFVAPEAGGYVFSTAGSGLPLMSIGVRDGCDGELLGCGSSTRPLIGADWSTAVVGLELAAGQAVAVSVSGGFSDPGDVVVSVSPPLPMVPPSHDACETARVLSADGLDADPVDFSFASDDSTVIICGNTPGTTLTQRGLWYRFTAPEDGVVSFGAIGNVDMILGAFDGTCDSLRQIGCGEMNLCVGSGRACGFSPTLRASVSRGQTIWFLLGAWNIRSSTIGASARVSFAFATPPANDQCDQAAVIGAAPFLSVQSSAAATADSVGDASVLCNGIDTSRSVWYALRTREAGTLSATLQQAPPLDLRFPAAMVLLDGTCLSAMEAGCVIAPVGLAEPIELTASLEADREYRLMIADVGGLVLGGRFQLDVLYTGSLAPECRADFNRSGTVTVQDIFDFLSAWFVQSVQADVNQSGTVSVQDVFDYLALYFVGCG